MKKDIHPQYQESTITCACGNIIKTGSVKKEMEIEICSACHPFYTGKKKVIDSAGQVDRFKKRMEAANQLTETAKSKKEKQAARKAKSQKEEK